jgi:hypothetical protein
MASASDLTPTDVLTREFVPDYERDIAALHSQVSTLRTNLFVLEHLVTFPFGVLAAGQAMFWSIVIRNLYFSSLVTGWGLAFDTDARSLTVARFRNEVLPNITKTPVSKAVRKRLAALDLEEVKNRLRPRLDVFRNKVIAHLDRALLSTPPGQSVKLPAISLAELKELCGVFEDMINILGFGTHYHSLPIDYEPTVKYPPDADPRPDVERLLDDLAKRSRYLNMPENEPQEWPFLCNALSDDDLNALNRYRVKFGLLECKRPST